MQFKYKSEDGEIELSKLEAVRDLETLKLGTPHKGSVCSFRILNVKENSTEQKPETEILLAPSTYLSLDGLEPSEPKNAIIGVTSTSEFDRLLDVCLTRLHVGETGEFLINCLRSETSYKISLELTAIQESVEFYDLSSERIQEMSNSLKNAGVCLFSQGYVVDAFYKFSEAMKFSCLSHPRTRPSARVIFISTLQNNMASCHVKLGNWEDAIDLCNSVLEQNPDNVKALYRRGSSLIEIQEYEKAEDSLQRARDLDPNNQAVKNKLAVLDERNKALDAKYAQAMKKFFL